MATKIILLLLLATSCTVKRVDISGTGLFSNQGVIAGGTSQGNTNYLHIENRPLTEEEIKVADAGYARARKELPKLEERPWTMDELLKSVSFESDISREDFIKREGHLLVGVHRDLVTILHLMYRRTPEFRITECARDLKTQNKNLERGVTTTIVGSRHVWIPAQACDIQSTRANKPEVNDKIDIHDVEFLGYSQATAEWLGEMLQGLPCESFASTVRRVFRWRTLRDLFHIETNARPECRDGYKKLTSFESLRRLFYSPFSYPDVS